MQTKDEMIIEQAKNLALTISILNSKYDKLLGEFTQKLSEVYLRLSDTQSKTQNDLEFISQQVVFQSTLTETKYELDSYINNIQENFNNYSLNHDHPYAIDSHLHDDIYSTVNHTHDYVETAIYQNEISDIKSNIDSYINNNEAFAKYISSVVQQNYEKLLSSLDLANINLDEVSKKLAKGIDDVDYKLDTFKSNTKKDINDIIEIIDDVKKNIQRDLLKSFKDVDSKIEKLADDVAEDLSELNDTVYQNKLNYGIDSKVLSKRLNELDKLVDLNDEKIHTETTKIEVKLNQLENSYNDLELSIDDVQINQETLKSGLDDAFSILAKKPEYSEILLKTDLDKLKQDIIDAVPVPKDGKDAEEWEFRPHPSRKGILIFKKKSQRNWNYIDLNHIVPKIQEYDQQHQSGGFIGGGGGGSSVSILWNNILVSANSNINFTGSAITSITNIDNITTVRIDGGTSGSGRSNYTTTEMNALSLTLNTIDDGFAIWNTTDKLGFTWSGTEFLQDGEVPVKTIRLDEASLTTAYIGEANVNSLENAPVWRIKRMTTNADIISVVFADGNSLYDNIWVDRLALTYS